MIDFVRRYTPPISLFGFLKDSDNPVQVPNRLNYLLWIQSLLDTTSESYSDAFDAERQVLGLDIGTGASCIYPLLGCSLRPKWRFVGTGRFSVPPRESAFNEGIDIDEKSLQFARENIKINGLQNRIRLHQSKPDGPLLPLDDLGFEKYDPEPCILEYS
jgi:23S rRNA (adenine1618-N6)-methyltransferase